MAIDANGNETWGLVEWALGGLATLVGSGLAFVWRMMLRIEKLESNQGRQRAELDTMRESSDGAMLRLGRTTRLPIPVERRYIACESSRRRNS